MLLAFIYSIRWGDPKRDRVGHEKKNKETRTIEVYTNHRSSPPLPYRVPIFMYYTVESFLELPFALHERADNDIARCSSYSIIICHHSMHTGVTSLQNVLPSRFSRQQQILLWFDLNYTRLVCDCTKRYSHLYKFTTFRIGTYWVQTNITFRTWRFRLANGNLLWDGYFKCILISSYIVTIYVYQSRWMHVLSQ